MDKIFQIITALGSLGTVGAFIFLLIENKRKQTQINKLTGIVDKLTDISATLGSQLKLSVQPDLYISGGGSTSGEFNIDIKNRGEKAVIQEIINNSNEVNIRPMTLPKVLEKGGVIKIEGIKTGSQPIRGCTIDIEIIYEDKLKNKYSLKIEGKGLEAKIIETEGV